MIESIYIDVGGESRSRYTYLIEQLAAVENARDIHVAMAARVLKIHENRIKWTRGELEAERERLHKLLKAAKA